MKLDRSRTAERLVMRLHEMVVTDGLSALAVVVLSQHFLETTAYCLIHTPGTQRLGFSHWLFHFQGQRAKSWIHRANTHTHTHAVKRSRLEINEWSSVSGNWVYIKRFSFPTDSFKQLSRSDYNCAFYCWKHISESGKSQWFVINLSDTEAICKRA